ncbi:Transportin-1-like Protein [Tribolium castaneum]|uniref:Transportin-1-like Protein n=1 Tax=Tribolium castaneum TaxID=7070 RepID=D6X2H3_TRICA|nr:Transportin-1-like Protein [Tribolium castaneum]
MDWSLWRPREETLATIKELLQDALIPDSEVQKDVQTKLKNLEIVDDFTYYLLYIVGQAHFSEEIRSLSGILLKNNIAAVYNKLPEDSIIKIRQLCLMLLRDPCRDVRTSISNVIYTLAKYNLNTWPELIPFLVKSFETPDEYSEVALTTLFSVCEEMMNLEKSEEEICTITKEVLPKFVDCLVDEKCDKKQSIIKLINQFLQDHYKVMTQSIDLTRYLRNVIQLADTDDLDMQKYICHTFVMYIEYREECLLPHLHDVIMYLLVKTQHEDLEVALGACEFWLAATKLANCKELLTPYIDKLVPVLLKNMKYSSFELIALKDTLRVEEQNDDPSKETFPFHMHDKRITRDDDTFSNEEGDFLGNCDDVDDFYVGWTLRKCSAASLDAIAVKFGEDILPLMIPFLNELLYHQDFLIKESAILALGAISEGCINGLKPHLPYLVQYLIHSMNDDHSMVRVITCWTLSRYVCWIINSQPSHSVYFIPVMTILLKHFMDENKRVQRAAISAFCVFQEEAQMQLIPYIDLILEGFQLGFQKFNYRSLYLLYDAINVLALSVGSELSKPEYIEKLMPPLIQKLNEYNNYSDDQFIAVLECLANIIPSLDAGFLPYSEVLYSQCMEIIMDTFMADANFQENLNGFDPPDKEPMHVALDVLYSMAVGLKSYFYKYVANSNLVCLLYTTMQDCSFLIRQSSIALYGELVLICYPYLSSSVDDYIKLIIKNLDECYEGVCKNAAWVIGKLTTVMGAEIRPYVPEILAAFINISRNPTVSRAMHQTVSVSLCTLCCVCPDIALTDADTVLKNCCLSLRSLKDSDEKDLAFRGLCQVVVRHPDFCQNNFMYFCDAVASWNSVKPDLKEMIKNILVSFKEQCGEMNWMQFYGQFPELLKLQLFNLYGV